MQMTVPRGELKDAVQGFNKIVSGKTTLPVLSCVRFDAGDNGVTVQATNLDETAQFRFGSAESHGAGSFIIPLASLKELAKGNGQETVEFESTDGTTVSITNHVGAHAVKHPVAGMELDEWPTCPDSVPTKPAEGFLETYRRALPFASSDTTRYTLNGVYVEVAEKGEHPVTMVATDGRRLSLWNTMNLPLDRSVIVPTTKFLQWNGLRGDAGIGLRTEQQKKEVIVQGLSLSVGPWLYDVKSIEGNYPNYRQVVPAADNRDNRITFTDEDVQALKKILQSFPGTGDSGAGIAIRHGADKKLIIAGRNPDDAQETTLELSGGSTFEGKMPGIGVNAFFLLDAFDAGFRVFTTNDELSPLRSDDNRGGIHVLMPFRLCNTPVQKPEPGTVPEQGNGVTVEPEKVPQAGTAAAITETKTPAETPVAKERKPKGEPKIMTKESNGSTEQGTAMDRVLAAVESAKGKVKEAVVSISELGDAVKAAMKEGKAQATDLEKARSTLQKLQAISL